MTVARDIGTKHVLADSSFRYESAPNITHATNKAGDRTLCGRACENWVEQDADAFPPDCLKCHRSWLKIMSQISPTSRVS